MLKDGRNVDEYQTQTNKFVMAVTALFNVRSTYRKILRKVLLATENPNQLITSDHCFLFFVVFSPAGLDSHKAKDALGALQTALTRAVAPATVRWRGTFADFENAPPSVAFRIWHKTPASERDLYTFITLYPTHTTKPPVLPITDTLIHLPIVPTKWTEPEEWQARPRRLLCEICNKGVSFCRYTDRNCKYCNNVSHLACLPEQDQSTDEWVCGDCLNEFTCSHGYAVAGIHQRELHEKQWRAQARIASFWRRLKAEAKFKRMRNKITVLQARFRGLIVRKHFSLYYQNLPKPYRIRVIRARNLPVADWDTQAADPYVVISILDHKYEQKWRFQTRLFNDELNPEFDETFLVPGVGGLSTLVFTVIDEDPLRHQFMGQAMVSLREYNRWKSHVKLNLSLGAKLYSVRDFVGQLARLDYGSITPQGVLEVEILPLNSCDAICGNVSGPNLDELAKAGVYMRNQELDSALRPIWATLADKKLYLCKRFGEAVRYTMDLTQASMQIHRDGPEVGFIFTPEKGARIKIFMVKPWEMTRWKVAVMMTYARNSMRIRGAFRYKNTFQMVQIALSVPEERAVSAMHDV